MNDYKTFGEYRTSEKSSASTALTFLFIGLGIGTIVALLFAPQSGKKMRKSLRRRYEDALDSVEDLRDQAGEYVERSRDLARDVKDKVSPIARKFRD